MAKLAKSLAAAGAATLLAAPAFAQAPPQPTSMPPFTPAVPATVVPSIPPVPPPQPEILKNFKPVTAEQLVNPADGDWPSFRRTYDGWGYSPLNQIKPSNVAKLKPVWSFATGQVEGHQAPPIVVNGVMFVSTPGAQVLAIDAKSGKILWRYRRAIPEDQINSHPTSRGVAVFGDKVFFCAPDASLVAINIKTGKEAWVAKVADYSSGYYMSLSPLVAGGKVMVGTSGGEYGIRGFVAAYDVDTGKEAWRTFTVPAPGEPGSETWPKGDEWKTGGGSIWIAGNYDPKTNIAYWGTGNGGPWMGDQRPGDNLYTSSTIALDVATGAIKGHFQYDPNESWDWDEVSPPILVDFKEKGKKVQGLVDVGRDGYLWRLERTDQGPIKFVSGQNFVRHNVYKGTDEKGRPILDESRKPGTQKPVEFCPSVWGGKDWPPVAWSPRTRLLYIPANENLCQILGGRPDAPKYVPGQQYTFTFNYGLSVVKGADHIGEMQAWNLDTGKRVWTTNMPGMSQNWGPVLATGGDLLFSGGTNDRKFRAFDARTGKILWEQAMPSGVTGVPTSYAIDGKQYVAVQAGWGVDGVRMQNALNRAFPGDYPEVPQGGSIWVFALQ